MLSMDSSAFAPMNYNYQNSQSSLGVAGLGYASRGKASNIRRISVQAAQNLSSADADNAALPTPRSSSRAQLLSGLRTAPKTPTVFSPTVEEPPMASISGLDNNRYSNQYRANSLPQNKAPRSVGFPGQRNSMSHQLASQSYQPRSSPPQQQQSPAVGTQQVYQNNTNTQATMAPQSAGGLNDIDNEARVYADLLAQNIYLAQQQQILQQQLRNVHQAQQLQQVQQQFQQVNLQSPVATTLQNNPLSPGMYLSNTSNFQGAGYYSMYNPLTGQYNYYLAQPPQNFVQPTQTVKAEEPYVEELKPAHRRSPSPPKINETKPEKTPTPPPFRRGHKKSTSMATGANANTVDLASESQKTSLPRTPLPSTPMQSTFGGKGDHPVRQPRGPPNFEEISAKPTTKHEGSKNFATRQRRRAISKLVHAGLERRGARSTGSNGGSMTPVSENEVSLNFEDSDSVTSSHSGRHSSQSMRGDGDYSASSLSGDENISAKPTYQAKAKLGLRPTFSTDKRKSALF